MTSKTRVRKTVIAYAFMAPALVLLIVFVFVPIVLSLPLAFFDYSVVGKTAFIGFDNFIRAFHDSKFWISIENSTLFVLVVPPIQLLSILLAILVNRKLPAISFFRALFYIPVITSMVAVSIMWGFLFDPNGIINTLMLHLHLISRPLYYLKDPHMALTTLMFITVWQGLGYYMMLYLAGLQSIPAEFEEAALVDGANRAVVLFRIKIPLLKPYVWFCSLLSVISAVNIFDIVYVLTQGTPANSTLVTNYYSFFKAFTDYEFGYSAAIGLLLAVITTTLSIVVFIYGRRGGMTYNE